MAGRTDPEETRQEILSATLKLLSENNYSGISMGTIAKVCKITKPAIYYHFKNKQDLFEQLTLYIMEKVNGIVAEHTELSARVRLTGICDSLFKAAVQSPYVVSAYLTMITDPGFKYLHEVEEFIAQFDQLNVAIIQIIKRGISSGEVNPDIDPEVTARIYQSTILGFLENSIFQQKSSLPTPSLLVNLLFSGIEHR